MEKSKFNSSVLWTVLLSLFLLLCCFVNTGDASITCYHCNSAYDPRCGDPFDPYSLGKVNCSMQPPPEHLPGYTPTLCRKNVQKVYGKVRVVRSCGYIEDKERDDKECVMRSGTHDVHMQYCACKGDLCNPAERVTTSFAVTTAFLFIGHVALVSANIS